MVRVEKNPFFQSNPPVISNPVFCFFEKKQVYILFFKKTKKNILNCFYCIMQYYHLRNPTIINCYSYYGILI